MTDHADLIARLRNAIVTASNDDMSAPGTPERERHVARLNAMEDAATALALLDERAALIDRAEAAETALADMTTAAAETDRANRELADALEKARAEAAALREALASYVEALRELRSAGLLGGRLLAVDDTARALTGGGK